MAIGKYGLCEMSINGTAPQRQTWIDALRLLAGLSMVGLHATADANGQPFPDADTAERIAPLLLRAVLYTARTELFLMISIFLLLQSLDLRARPYPVVIREQARRLLVPFVFWTVFYALYSLIKADAFGYLAGALERTLSPWSWVGFLTLGSVKYHMHFIPTLFGLVLIYPLYRVAHAQPLAGLAIIACLLIKRELDGFLYPNFWGTDALPYLVRATKILTYAGYGLAAASLLGIWQRTEPRQRQQWVGLLVLLGGLLFLIKLISSYQTIQTGKWAFDYTPGYWADFLMPAVLMATCMCLAHKRWPGVLSRLARYSFGIYLCHPIFLDMAEIALAGQALTPIQLILCKIAWTLPMTCLFVWALSRIPPLAWTIGLGPLPRLRRQPLRAANH